MCFATDKLLVIDKPYGLPSHGKYAHNDIYLLVYLADLNNGDFNHN